MKIKSAGIIAAGEGSRFKNFGIAIPKPMIPVSSFPLIGHTIKNLESAGIKRVVVILNELEKECVRWVQENFSRLEFEFIVKSTQSSFESFWLVGKKLGVGRHLISTVDSVCLPEELKKMITVSQNNLQTATEDAPPRIYLGVTSFVDDQKPLWVKMNKDTNQIMAIGDQSFSSKSRQFVTAGFYNVSHTIFQSMPKAEIPSLRWYLKWLMQSGFQIYGVPLAKVVDVDIPNDILIAEELLSGVKIK